ncbi:UDP-2,4-diacetamido-2,4,6-trideoxy-beta-L-altropyranose hydrolase [Dapis sp. BLCC M126]|uniref:UDP-2,4-diacetamido-2,4, 6-trideoxy-beta-L-altropyranose hydrolase n=1 Tax=Dapis sp. BLCC M126 TaxID=3400189 RepID=UPI003CED6D63
MKLLIRVDASTKIGTGHVMRCLALAQALQDEGGEAIFALATHAPNLESRLRSEGMKVVHIDVKLGSTEDASETSDLANSCGCQWVVVDGYHFLGEYKRQIKDAGLSSLFIDDYGNSEYYYADFILNQNVYAHEGFYQNRESYTKLLLGTKYALLRREFCQWQEWVREIPPVARKILVTLGGADPDNVTLKVIQALQEVIIDGLEVVVVVGGSNPHYEELLAAVEKSEVSIELRKNVTNMPELMAWADIAIAAGGSTTWELAFMGLPSLLIVLADNQRAIAETLNKIGVSVNLGWHSDVSANCLSQNITQLIKEEKKRSQITKLSQQLVDGDGSSRVLMELEAKKLRLRKVGYSDRKLLWDWANETTVREVSFSSAKIPWKNHVQWFDSMLKNSNCIMYIGVNQDDSPVGQIRYNIEDGDAVISISIAREFRALGYGTKLIWLASEKIFDVTRIKKIHAYIKASNYASIRAFTNAGFLQESKTKVQGQFAIHLVKQR